MQIWYAIPSANVERATRCFASWRARGFRTAVLLDPGAEAPPNAHLVLRPDTYRGYFASINQLAAVIARQHKTDIVIAGGDDMFPDPRFTAEELARQFFARFPDGFGVMQPTGDDLAGTTQICGSPWFGHGWLKRAYRGRGPVCGKYRAFFGDEELKIIAEKLGVLWQRPDVTQRHDHWVRPGGPPKQRYQVENDRHWPRDQTLFEQRRAAGWPNSSALSI